MFALLALGGDVGCSFGPTFVGTVSSMAQGDLHFGILTAVVFPAAMLAGCLLLTFALKRRRQLKAAPSFSKLY